MQRLEEFRILNDRVKAGQASAEDIARWNEIKGELIRAIRSETPTSVSPVTK